MSVATERFLTVVSGLPRSGTSMMMRMLEQGGLPVMIDGQRTADDDNPNGYYEFEAVKQTRENPTWLEGSDGKVVKMVYRLLYDLPNDRTYKVLFMTRELDEVLASQRVMLQRNGVPADAVSDEQMAAMFRSDLKKFREWQASAAHIDMIDVSYNAIQSEPMPTIRRINEFLGGGLDIDAMASVVDGSLYRNRK